MANKKYVQKYIVPPVIATTILLSPLITTNVAAQTYYSIGDSGAGVSDVQESLVDFGYHTNIDGSFGPDTRRTVMNFQSDRSDLQVDGMAGPNTLEALENDSSNESSSSVEYYAYGDTGSGVRNVQSDLNAHGFNTSVDGSYGPDTRRTVRSFQSANGLQVDGMAGPETLNALRKETSGDTSSDDSNQTSGIVSTAQNLVGAPYVFGGTTPSGFDSSGFINYVFNQQGVNLSRTHAGMWANNGVKVGDPEPGDVVFFEGTYKPGISHSGIYIGNGKMIHAGTPSTGVEVKNMNYDYWQSRYIGAKSFT